MYELLLRPVPGWREPLHGRPPHGVPRRADVQQGHLLLQRGRAVLVGGALHVHGGGAVQEVVKLELGLVEDAGGVERVVLDGVGGGPGN